MLARFIRHVSLLQHCLETRFAIHACNPSALNRFSSRVVAGQGKRCTIPRLDGTSDRNSPPLPREKSLSRRKAGRLSDDII